MKTIKELVQDSDNLNKFMAQAANDKAENHLLSQIDDVYAQEVYLTLLISVAEASGQFDESAENPLMYVCKIAAAFDKVPDMQEILRRSLLIDEKVLTDYAVTLNQHGLQNLFLFDALTLMSIYAKDNSEIFEYIAGISNMLNIDAEEFKEILIVTKIIKNKQEEISQTFNKLFIENFLPYLKKFCKKMHVEAPDFLIFSCTTETDITEEIGNTIDADNKKGVFFKNIFIHDKKITFNISNTEKVEFIDCRFERLTDDKIRGLIDLGDEYTLPAEITLMNIEHVETLNLTRCKFIGMISNVVDYRYFIIWRREGDSSYIVSEQCRIATSGYNSRGILIHFEWINLFILHDCYFEDCYLRWIDHLTGFFGDDNLFHSSSHNSIERVSVFDTIKNQNLSLEFYLKYASQDKEKECSFNGYYISNDDIKNNTFINSYTIHR